jgi:hypothetical protein
LKDSLTGRPVPTFVAWEPLCAAGALVDREAADVGGGRILNELPRLSGTRARRCSG